MWTITARPGITFHDGTPLDGAAIVDNLNRFQDGLPHRHPLANVDSVAVDPTDPMTVVVTVKKPWATFPYDLDRPDRLHRLADVAGGQRQRRDAAVEAGRHRPVHLRGLQAERVLQGQAEPELLEQALPVPRRDRVPSRSPTRLNRRDALKSGDVDMIHTTNGQVITEFRDNQGLPARGDQQQRPRPATRCSHGLTAGRLAADRPAGALRAGLRLRRPGHHHRPSTHGVFQIANGPFSPGTRSATWRTPATRRSRTWTRPRA